jgi:hypothetical protein
MKSVVFLFALAVLAVSLVAAATPKEAVGFHGTATGTVKSVQADGCAFVLTVSSAKAADASTVKDTAPMIGKSLTLGTRMPRDKNGTPHNHPDDVAYIKSLKPGSTITVKIFAVKADPTVLRIQEPGKPASQPASQP